MHTVFALLCFVVVIHWLIFQYPSGLLHWHCGNLTIAPVPAKQPWWIWINTSCEFIMKDCVTTTKQSTTKPCAYFLGYTVGELRCVFCADLGEKLSYWHSNRFDIITKQADHYDFYCWYCIFHRIWNLPEINICCLTVLTLVSHNAKYRLLFFWQIVQ